MKSKDLKKELHAQIDRIENIKLLQSLLSLLKEKENNKVEKYSKPLTQLQQNKPEAAYEESEDEKNLIAKEDFMELNAGDRDVKTAKLELIQLLLKTEKADVLEKVKSVLNEESNDWWDDLSDEEKKEIEIGLQDVENGNVVEYEEVKKLFRK